MHGRNYFSKSDFLKQLLVEPISLADCVSQYLDEICREQKHSSPWPWLSDLSAGLVWFWISVLVSIHFGMYTLLKELESFFFFQEILLFNYVVMGI